MKLFYCGHSMILTAAEAVILYRWSTKAYCIILPLCPNILNLVSLMLLLQCLRIWFDLVMGLACNVHCYGFLDGNMVYFARWCRSLIYCGSLPGANVIQIKVLINFTYVVYWLNIIAMYTIRYCRLSEYNTSKENSKILQG